MGLKVPSNQSGIPRSVRHKPPGHVCNQTFPQPEHLLCPHRMDLKQQAGSMQRGSQLQGAPGQSNQQQVHIPALPSSALRRTPESPWHSKAPDTLEMYLPV